MQEQAVLFMSSLWLYAVFVSAADATDLGYAYLIMRSMYPVIWAVLGGEKGQPEAGSMFTFPQYAINLYEVNKQKTRAARSPSHQMTHCIPSAHQWCVRARFRC